jgi:hypothetical protein
MYCGRGFVSNMERGEGEGLPGVLSEWNREGTTVCQFERGPRWMHSFLGQSGTWSRSYEGNRMGSRRRCRFRLRRLLDDLLEWMCW